VTDQERADTVVTAAHSLGGKLIGALPAQFLMLVILNSVFIGALFWLLDGQNKARERVIGPIVSRCMDEVPAETLVMVLKEMQQERTLQCPKTP
jgi:hypothetical protein